MYHNIRCRIIWFKVLWSTLQRHKKYIHTTLDSHLPHFHASLLCTQTFIHTRWWLSTIICNKTSIVQLFKTGMKIILTWQDFCSMTRLSLLGYYIFQSHSKCRSANQRPGGHLCFPLSPKKQNLIEDVEIWILVKFRWISISGFRGISEKSKMPQPIRGRAAIFIFQTARKTQTW